MKPDTRSILLLILVVAASLLALAFVESIPAFSAGIRELSNWLFERGF